MAKQEEFNKPVSGMNKGTSIYEMQPNEYSLAININRINELGGDGKRVTESSNLLATKFKTGYFVVGFENDITTNATYFFLTNPTTGISEFGRIKDNQILPDLGDSDIVNCSDCDERIKLSEPLEKQMQVPTQVYETLLEDSCNQCLGLSIHRPIKKIEIKNEKCGNTLYFTDSTTPRYIQLDNLDIYSYTGTENCGEDDRESTCLDCNKLRVFKIYRDAQINTTEIILGGRLPLGAYEFLIAYSDKLGNELSEYFSITQPVHIFDTNDVTLEQSELNKRTNLAIKLDVNNLDRTFNYYKVVVIQSTSLDGATRYFEEGIHPITDNSVLYTTEDGKRVTDINSIFQTRPTVTKAEGLMQANNHLFLYGIENEKEWNLQPVVNLLGSFIKWQTSVTTEEYYAQGIHEKSFMRDESYPLSIRFHSNNGYKTALFPFISRPADATELQIVSTNDTASINNNINSCNSAGRTRRFEFYNTAEEEGSCSLSTDIQISTITEKVFKTCTVDNAIQSGPGTFSIENIDDFSTLDNLVNDILERGECFDYPFCSVIDFNTTPTCTPDYTDCNNIELKQEFFRISDEGVLGESLTYIEKSFPNDYRRTAPSSFCNIYITNQSGGYEKDEASQALLDVGNIFYRNYFFTNDSCSYAKEVKFAQDTTTTENYFHNYFIGNSDMSSVQTSYGSDDSFYMFSDKVHRNALWFEIPLADKDRFIFEITKQINPSGDDGISRDGDQYVRYTFFDGCNSTVPLYAKVININQGDFIMLEKNSSGTQISFEDQSNIIVSKAITERKLVVAVDNIRQQDLSTDNWFTRPTNGCFGVVIREPEIAQINVTYTNITFDKVQKYEAQCDFEIPIVNECKLIPHKYGKFAYVESTENYPDNQELYNSKSLQIKESDFTSEVNKNYFEESYVSTKDFDGNYTLSEDTNFSCKPIRHFKFPDNKVSPFIYENQQSGFTPSIIYPIGITIDEVVINDFLDIAVNNSLITQEQRDSITGYEIFRGDRTLNKSIVAKGLLYDMFKYEENGKEVMYSNYPYNDLGEDELNYQDESRTEFIQHPTQGDSNSNFTFHSPETDYLKPTLPSEMKVEGYMFGTSRGSFDEVDGHSKWTILGAQSYKLASNLATAEVAAEAALNVALAYGGNNLFFGGVSTGGTFVGVILATIAAGFQVASAIIYKYGRYKYEWLVNFRNLGQPENFAYYYSSEGYYNYLKTLQSTDNELRSINLSTYLKGTRKILVDKVDSKKIEINNLKREESVYLSIGENFPLIYPDEYKEYDNGNVSSTLSSRTYLAENLNCETGRSAEINRQIASPYVSLKNYLPSQYGTIDSVKWLTTSYKGNLLQPKNTCLSIYGGDVVISRHILKRKIPMFLRDAYDIASLTPFNYKFYGNIGQEPRFYCNYEVTDETNIDRGFPTIESQYNLDCLENSRGFYVKPPSKFYLYYYGIPNFLTETTVNTNFRYGKKQPEENFYPNVGDYMEWTQQKTVPLKERNRFFYNFTYSKGVTPSLSRTLPSTYNKEEYDCRFDDPNGGIYSLPDSSENDLYDPWLIFKPLNKFSFSSSKGKLIDMRGIENEQVMTRFEDGLEIYNAVDTTVDDGQRPETKVLGNGGMFTRRPRTFAETDLGKWGSSSVEMSSNEFGHFYVDAQRGTITQLYPSSQNIKEISKYGSQNRPNGMFSWFKEHIPFKILNSRITNYETIDTDNPYNGVGFTIGYDDRYKRVFFTKKDYIPKVSGIVHENGVFTHNNSIISLQNSEFFIDCSWTLAYDPLYESWISYYDYKPNYYIAHNNYFQTGINSETNENGLWSHNLTNKSFRVFYGKAYPSEITFATKNDFKQTNLNTIMFKSEAKRYHDKYDYAYEKGITWNQAMIFSSRENSGLLNLVPQKTLAQITKYPITKSSTLQDILVTNSEELWSFDYFYNRVKLESNNQPHLLKDENDIRKTVNPKAVSFYGKKVLETLSSTAFNVNLMFDKDTRYEVDLQWTINQENK